MTLIGWLKGRLSHRDKALSLYKQGIAHAKLHDHEAAILDYTAVIDMADAPPDVRAMAIYNRSVVHTANHHDPLAISDLEMLLAMTGAAANVRTEARRKLVRMQRTTLRTVDSLAPASSNILQKGTADGPRH
jgi:hypothetical protein